MFFISGRIFYKELLKQVLAIIKNYISCSVCVKIANLAASFKVGILRIASGMSLKN